MRRMKIGIIFGVCLAFAPLWSDVPSLLVLGASQKRSAADLQREQVMHLLSTLKRPPVLSVKKVDRMWLVELETRGMSEALYEEIVAKLEGAGIASIAVEQERKKGSASSSSREKWQWGILLALALVGTWFFVRRFLQTRSLGKSQKALEKRQQGLEGKLEQRGSP
ncbi:hypothetical protein [Nitratifractor sp.]